MRRATVLFAILCLMALVLAGLGYRNARADPVVREASIDLPAWPDGRPAVRVVLLSDIHLGNIVTDDERLSRIVAQVNALAPDLVLIAGDFVAGHDRFAAAASAKALTAPLKRLRAPLGVVATLGNHDYGTNAAAIRRQLERAGVIVLENDAVTRGPLVIGGIADSVTGHQDFEATAAAMDSLRGARLALSHAPDVTTWMPPDVTLVLAGHTHCGQVVLPGIGPLGGTVLPRYVCGLVREGTKTTVITGGTGTSIVPFRFGAPPDIWLLHLGPAVPR